jgi:hypothetical protein
VNFTIREKADYVGTLRSTRVFMMETLARWIPATPELEVKVMFGRHLWDMAQHADQLGKRTYELRASLHYSPVPSDDFVDVLKSAADASTTEDKIHVFYSVLLPAMEKRVKHYVNHTDALQDEPTVRILEGILRDDTRILREAQSLLAELSAIPKVNAAKWTALAGKEAGSEFVCKAAKASAVEVGA